MADAARIAFQISLFVVFLGYGLTAQVADVTHLLRLPDLLTRSLLAVLLIAPVTATVLVGVLDLPPQVAIALVTLALSPLPPLLPRRGENAGGHVQYGLGLVLILAVLALPVICVATPLIGHVFGRQYVASTWSPAELMLISVVAPLVAGMAIRSRRPALADRIRGPIERVQRWAMPVAAVILLIDAAPSMWKLLGQTALIAMVLFVGSMFLVGHVLGGPERESSAVLAFASSCRHPAIALTIASADSPNADEHGAVALYGLITAVLAALYVYWMRRRATAPAV